MRATTGSTKGLAPAVSVAVVEKGKLVYVRAFGVADIAAKTPATPATRFRIGSVTKMFTAVSVMQQVEKGAVRLDEPLATYLPDAPHAQEVTIRQLLMHASGIWNYGDEAFLTGRVATPATPREIVAWTAERPLEAQPGAKFVYSNTGYVLLGLVVEAVTRQPLARYVQTNILSPAGMTETTFGELPSGVPVASGYMDATGTLPPPYSPSWFYADGDIVSTASDLARFDVALMDGHLVKSATFAAMQSNAVDALVYGPGVRYGLGLTLISSAGHTLVGHHGGVPGFEAENEMVPAHRYAIVVLSDAFDFLTARAKKAIVGQTFPALVPPSVTTTPGPGATEDPAVAPKLRTFIAALQTGTVDRATLTDSLNAAYTPEVLTLIKAQFAPFGELQTLTLRDTVLTEGYHVYHYTAVFSSGRSLLLNFALDEKDAKIGGFSGT